MTRRSATSSCLAAVLPLIVFLCVGCDFDKRGFLDVSKSTFASFYNNSGIADSTIDWRVLSINGDEVGRTYLSLSTDYDKTAFRRSTVIKLRSLCTAKGWNTQSMRDWKIKERGVESCTVEGDAPGGSITITLRKYGAEKKIGSIQIR